MTHSFAPTPQQVGFTDADCHLMPEGMENAAEVRAYWLVFSEWEAVRKFGQDRFDRAEKYIQSLDPTMDEYFEFDSWLGMFLSKIG